ncbi:MAG: hypothetical protein FWE22_05190 [Firmicutes bacterium]|nr:hypothetical protein [Bacillota bacterium]
MNITALIISLVSLAFTTITIVWAYIDRSNRYLKYRICKYIYQYYSPIYFHDKLPSSADVFKHFNKRNRKNKQARLQYLLIELSHENMIEMLSTTSDSFESAKWKPNVNINKPK